MSFQLLQDLLLQVAGDHKLVEIDLSYNPHTSCYNTVLEDHQWQIRNWKKPPAWVSKDQMNAAIESNVCWDLGVSIMDVEKNHDKLDTKCIAKGRACGLPALFSHLLDRVLTLDEVCALEAVTESIKSLLHGQHTQASVTMKTYSAYIRYTEKLSDKGTRIINNVEQIMDDTDMHDCREDWIGDDELWKKTDQALAIKNNRLWNITVYPNTPVGFYDYYGSGLEVILTPILNAEIIEKEV